jgi:hypothetical protein
MEAQVPEIMHTHSYVMYTQDHKLGHVYAIIIFIYILDTILSNF